MNNKRLNILLVEDDKVNQFVTSSLLSKWGLQVSIANDGAEAIKQISKKKFHLVMMDIQMPVMDGLESTQIIRAMDDPYFKSIPIIAFTASGMIETREMVIKCGMNDFVAKPLDPEELKRKINKYIGTVHRPLFIDFELHTEGDPEFKKELISLLIENIRELQHSLVDHSQDAPNFFLAVLHKVKSTVAMLCDEEFIEVLDEIKAMSIAGRTGAYFHKRLNYFSRLCDLVIQSLDIEASSHINSAVKIRSDAGYNFNHFDLN